MTRKEHNVDAHAKGAASFFVACVGNPATILKIPADMRAKGYSDTEAVDQALQMPVHREVEKLKGEVSAAVPAALSAAAVMVTLSSTVTTRALALIPQEDANSTLMLDLPLPPRKTHRTSHQRQIDHQNERKSKDPFGWTVVTARACHRLHRMRSNR